MKKHIKKLFYENPKFKKTSGVVLVVIGFIGLITPFTPFGILFFVGLEMLGIRFLYWDKIKARFKKNK